MFACSNCKERVLHWRCCILLREFHYMSPLTKVTKGPIGNFRFYACVKYSLPFTLFSCAQYLRCKPSLWLSIIMVFCSDGAVFCSPHKVVTCLVNFFYIPNCPLSNYVYWNPRDAQISRYYCIWAVEVRSPHYNGMLSYDFIFNNVGITYL